VSARFLRVSALSKRYGALLALDGVSFEVGEGQCLALIGPNGAGKSSLLRILGGTARADSGKVEGIESFRLAYVPDRLEFPSSTSALDWLVFLARLKGAARRRPEADAVARRALESVGLGDVADKEASGLSRGMQQRLLFAQALLGEPDIVLMDEPASALDPIWAIDWKEKLASLRRSGTTVIFSTHRVGEASALADRVLLFHRGRLLRDEASGYWRAFGEGGAERRFLELVGGGAA